MFGAPRKTTLLLIHLFLAAFALGCGAQQNQSAKANRDQFQGQWSLAGYTVNGIEAPSEILEKVQVVFREDQMIVSPMPVHHTDFVKGVSGFEFGRDFEEKFELGAAGKVQTFDFLEDLAGKTYRSEGIYKLELDGDELWICFSAGRGKDRPTGFSSKPQSNHRLMHLKRVKQ